MDLNRYIERQQARINAALDRLVPHEETPPATIHRAVRYSLFAGGKRVRPILAIAAAEAVPGEAAGSGGLLDAACTLEMIHTYSLIHDDLPALDNDDLRRGRPTSHKVFGEAMAILAGDALLTLAFEVLARVDGCEPARKARIVGDVAAAAGTVRGMIAGQVNDLEGEGREPTPELLDSIHRAKTGAMIIASVRLGAVFAGATEDQVEALACYGSHTGLAFQIVDDILDVEQPSEKLGKTAGKDTAQKKITFPAVYGLERSKAMAEEERRAAHQALERFGDRALRLRELCDLIVRRTA